jgi:hypothetical protein
MLAMAVACCAKGGEVADLGVDHGFGRGALGDGGAGRLLAGWEVANLLHDGGDVLKNLFLIGVADHMFLRLLRVLCGRGDGSGDGGGDGVGDGSGDGVGDGSGDRGW